MWKPFIIIVVVPVNVALLRQCLSIHNIIINIAQKIMQKTYLRLVHPDVVGGNDVTGVLSLSLFLFIHIVFVNNH